MAKHRTTPFRFLLLFTIFMFNVFAGVSLQWALHSWLLTKRKVQP